MGRCEHKRRTLVHKNTMKNGRGTTEVEFSVQLSRAARRNIAPLVFFSFPFLLKLYDSNEYFCFYMELHKYHV